MQLDTFREKAEPDGSSSSRGSVLMRWLGRFRLALSRTRPYILGAGAIYVGAFLLSFIIVLSLPEHVRDGLVSPGDRWLLRQPIVEQPIDLNLGFADWVYVFRHNVVAGLVGIVTAGVPGILINAYGLGESAAAVHAAGKNAIFWSLILPHGLLEISVSCVASGVGLRFGHGLLTRMRHRTDPRGGVRAALADGIVLSLGLILPATAVAALIEVKLTTMWMPLPLAILFGAFAATTFLALTFGVMGPVPGASAAERGNTVDHHAAAPAKEDPVGREIPGEDMARARSALREIAEGGSALDVVWKRAPRSARAPCVRVARRGQAASDPITAALVTGLARRFLSRRNQLAWIAYVSSLSLLVALAGGGWVALIGLGLLGAVLWLRTRAGSGPQGGLTSNSSLGRSGVKSRSRRRPRAAALRPFFWGAIEPGVPLQPRSRAHATWSGTADKKSAWGGRSSGRLSRSGRRYVNDGVDR